MASDIIQTVTDSTFEQSVVKSATPVLIDFWAEWCMPCKRIAPTVDQLANDFAGRLTVAKMNVDENSEVPMRLGIRGIPTLMIFKGGEMVDTIVGAVDKDTIKKMVERHV
ncbi:MAG TPA: thioredoxin [Vicinamibacterales bacterium]|jgi:thioredoxin 1